MSCLSCTEVYSPRGAPYSQEKLILTHVPIDLIPSLKSVFGEDLKSWVVTPLLKKKQFNDLVPYLDDDFKTRISRVFYRTIANSVKEGRAFELNSVNQGIQLSMYHWSQIPTPEFVFPCFKLGRVKAHFFFSEGHLKGGACFEYLNPHWNLQITASVTKLTGWDQNSRSLIEHIKIQESLFNAPVKRCILMAQFTTEQEKEILARHSTWASDEYNPKLHLELCKKLQKALLEKTGMPADMLGLINEYLFTERVS